MSGNNGEWVDPRQAAEDERYALEETMKEMAAVELYSKSTDVGFIARKLGWKGIAGKDAVRTLRRDPEYRDIKDQLRQNLMMETLDRAIAIQSEELVEMSHSDRTSYIRAMGTLMGVDKKAAEKSKRGEQLNIVITRPQAESVEAEKIDDEENATEGEGAV